MRLLLECLPDETLVRQLGLTRRDCQHLNDKGRVCNRLKKSEGLLALIDHDPGAAQPPYLLELRMVSDEHGVRILRDEKREHRVIILQPRLEEWIIQTAASANIDPKAYGLSDRGNDLHRDLHREVNFRLRGFMKMIEALLSAKSPGLARLAKALKGSEYAASVVRSMNQLYYGDSLQVLRKHIADESTDLIYFIRRLTRNAVKTCS